MKTVTTARMKAIDRATIQQYKIPEFLLMDNAGRCVAEAARELMDHRGKHIVVVSGGGNNGADGIVAARYLRGWGYHVKVFYLKNPRLWKEGPALHYRIAKRLGVAFASFGRIPHGERAARLREASVVIDALLGTGVQGRLRAPFLAAITAMNASRRPIIAVDIPSGLDPDTGAVRDAAVLARQTVTMAAVKRGLLQRAARRYVGRLRVADIGIPLCA